MLFTLNVLIVDEVCKLHFICQWHLFSTATTSCSVYHLITAIAYYLDSHSFPHPFSVYSLYSRKSKCSPHPHHGKFSLQHREHYRNHNQSKHSPAPIYASIHNVTPIPKTQGSLWIWEFVMRLSHTNCRSYAHEVSWKWLSQPDLDKDKNIDMLKRAIKLLKTQCSQRNAESGRWGLPQRRAH